jgi:hypothetical protein
MASSMAMAAYGQQHGALLVAIEHRYYGKSQPFASYADMSLLSVDQALADYAAIIDFLAHTYNTTNSIVFGCSYIGSGAAWFRSKVAAPHCSVRFVLFVTVPSSILTFCLALSLLLPRVGRC